MKVEIKVPSMGESVTEATIGTLIKENGAWVNIDEEICELETDKVNQVLFAPQSGKLTFEVSPDQTVKIGQVIGYVETDAKAPAPEAAPKKIEAAIPAKNPNESPSEGPKKAVSIPPSGENARLSREEYLKDLKAPPTLSKETPQAPAPTKDVAPRSETRKKMSKIRKVIASRLVEAQHNTAMLTTFNEVDMSAVMELRAKYKDSFEKKHASRLGFMSFFVKATVVALRENPEVNSYIDGEEIVQRNYFDIGIAVGTERGVIVPVVRDCDRLSFAQIEKTLLGYAEKARKGTISIDDLQGGGFTITNGGVYGSLLSTPILNSPQSGILGMHNIVKRPVVVNDQIVIRPMMYLALSYDHRIVDGKEAVTFLIAIKNALEDPARLLLDL
jgi:2-oxoglutarate dehydrogenase E2 component (dihydrolipoamide succinyltransferase)